MLECVVNLSEGRDLRKVEAIAQAAGRCILDVHSDHDHNRSVLTMAAPEPYELENAVRAVAAEAVERLDLRTHQGAHLRFGVLDVVPFVPLTHRGRDPAPVSITDAVAARDRFAQWAADELSLPCFLYGPERSLPEVRRDAFVSLSPDNGSWSPHPTAGACAVGARPVLVAYNVVLSGAGADIALARQIAGSIRSRHVRALGFEIGEVVQVSCNLLDPLAVGPDLVYDEVTRLAREAGVHSPQAELVGLLPRAVLLKVDRARWRELDIGDERTIEARIDEHLL